MHGEEMPGNNMISQVKGQAIKVSHDCIMSGKQALCAALTSCDLTKVGKWQLTNDVPSFNNAFKGSLNWKDNKATVQ